MMSSPFSSTSMLLPQSPRTLAANDACGGCNTGVCVEPSTDTSLTSSTSATPSSSSSSSTLGTKPSCDCRSTGYVGEHCTIPCSLPCRHGGKCIPPTRIDEFTQEETCACARAVVDGNPYAGIHCEYGATQSCMTLGSESKHSFCTNGGACVEIVGDNEEHVPCSCTEGYTGDKCEYLVGNVPSSYTNSSSTAAASAMAMEQQQKSESVQSHQSVIFFAIIVAMGAMILLVILGMIVRSYTRNREAKRQEREARRATEDFTMVPMRENDDADEEEEDGII